MIRYIETYIALTSVPSVLCFVACIASVTHQIICFFRKRMNSYLPYEIGVMLILGVLDAIQRIFRIIGNLFNHYTGASPLISHATAKYEALSDAFFIFHILTPALYAILICLVLNIVIKWRTRGSSVPSTKCRVR